VQAVPRPEVLRARAGFLSDCGWDSRRATLSSLERRDRQFAEALRDGLEVVLWFEHDLYDQLQLLDALAREVGASLELIVIGSFHGKPSFGGLGELTAEELEMLWPTRRAATPEALDAGAATWDAFRAPEPTALAERAKHGSPEMPFLAPALLRLLEELPAPVDGLSGTERRALQAIAADARTPQSAFAAAQRLEDAPFLGDAWFYRALATLGRGRVRLVETQDGEPLPAPPPLSDGHAFARLPLRLTAEGKRVLRGESDRVDLLGVDRWIGGTHVTPENVWRWDSARHRLVAPLTHGDDETGRK
jgi:hypothetical protein